MVVLIGILNIFFYQLYKQTFVYVDRLIPRDISEHTEEYPTFSQIHSAIKGEQTEWTKSFEKNPIVNNRWLSLII